MHLLKWVFSFHLANNKWKIAFLKLMHDDTCNAIIFVPVLKIQYLLLVWYQLFIQKFSYVFFSSCTVLLRAFVFTWLKANVLHSLVRRRRRRVDTEQSGEADKELRTNSKTKSCFVILLPSHIWYSSLHMVQLVSLVIRPAGIATAQFFLVPSACFPSAAVNKCRSVILTVSAEYCRSARRKACCVEYTVRRGGRKTNETHCTIET